MAKSLKQSEKEIQIDHLRTNTDHLVKKIVKIGPVYSEIIGLQEIVKKEFLKNERN